MAHTNKNYLNNWLIDEEFLRKVPFSDKYYLITVCRHIYNFLQNAPVPVFSNLDRVFNDRIYINVGDNSKCFFFDTTIAYYDFITLIKRYIKKFYPSYSCETKITREYTEEEIISLRKKSIESGKAFDLNDILNQQVPDSKWENGYISKIFILKDTFILNVNGKKYLHKTVTANRALPLRQFLKGLRSIIEQTNDDKIIRSFILENSERVSELKEETRITIQYSGGTMLNFFKINYEDLQSFALIQNKDNKFRWSWGKFDIIFENSLLMEDCLVWYNCRKNGE